MTRAQIIEHFIFVCRKPGIFVNSGSYVAVCAYLSGFDNALCGAALDGFREWLLMRGKEWNNMTWWALVRTEVLGPFGPDTALSREDDQRLLAGLDALLSDFSEAVAGGMDRLYFQYGTWLHRQGRTFGIS